ncbi:MAG: hypothetical protein KDB03_07245 [Planctomycetales bacterium]|nr:hypothetical protein [Planctomycetales bacterium]
MSIDSLSMNAIHRVPRRYTVDYFVIRQIIFVATIFVSALTTLSAEEPAEQNALSLNEHLMVFQPLLGKTYRGSFADQGEGKETIDVSSWERAMNGQAVRGLHSINDGEYGGETIIMWDPKQEKIAFWYFTTAGFFTQGTMEIEGDTWSSTEEVTGNANGISRVKAISKILENGNLEVKSEYFGNGKWSPGHAATYTEAPDAKVVFR